MMKEEKNPYKVPEDYFKSLEESILERTVLSGTTPRAVVTEHQPTNVQRGATLRSMMGFAAGFAIFVTLAYGAFYLMLGDNGSIEKNNSILSAEEELFWGSNNNELIDFIIENDEYEALLAEEVSDYIDLWGVGNTEIVLDIE